MLTTWPLLPKTSLGSFTLMTESKRNEIISRWRAGSSIRQIARELGLARNTVRRVLAQIEARRAGAPDGSPTRWRPSRLDPYEPVIRELLGRYPDLTAVRLLEELRQRGFTGGYTVIRQRLSELRPRSAPPPVVRFETAPGAQAQMDYAVYDLDFTSEGRRRVCLFSYILGSSRRQYLRFVESQDMTTTLREHLRAFEHLGGVAATCLYDNMKVVVTGYENDVPIYSPQVEEITRHALLPATATGQRSVHKEHCPSEDARHRQAQLEERFVELGETGRRFLEGLLRTQRYGKDQAQRVLALLGSYTRGELIAALERAARYGAYSHAAVERILSVQAQPKSTLESLAEHERRHLPPWLDEEPVSPRPTSDYQPLCDQEPTDHAEATDPSDDAPAGGAAPEGP